MSGDPADVSDEAGADAPIDFDRLSLIRERFAGDERFSRLVEQPDDAPTRLVCVYSERLYPTRVESARLEIVWFENGDFSLHYHEDHTSGTFDHRWDRHPSDHNTRDHVHPGPEAPTPGEDASHPEDWRDTLSMVLAEIDDRQRGFWED
jgi:hypothetical protein